MSTSFRFSIIIPSYNQGNYLREALNSVVNQKFNSVQIIVIDGGSKDNSVEIVKEFKNEIDYWCSEPDLGTFDANNKGLAKVRGEYWCILNSDDLLKENSLKTVDEFLTRNPSEKWICGGVEHIDASGKSLGVFHPKKPKPLSNFTFLDGCWISHPTVFLHSSLISEAGLFERWNYMDLNYWLRLEKLGYSPAVLPESLACLRYHDDCKSVDLIKMKREVYRLMNTFVIENGISDTLPVKRKISELEKELKLLEIIDAIVKNNRKAAAVKLLALGYSYPKLIATRSYWGLIRRWLKGIKINDPVLKLIGIQNGKANWT